MTLDPVLMEILSSLPPGEPMAPLSAGLDEVTRTRAAADAGADALARRVTEPGPDVAQVVEVWVAEGVRARLYQPAGPGPFGAHLYLHGGSFTMGSPDALYVDATCRERCAVGLVVLSLDYRLAPEHVFPTAVQDSYTALCWLRDHAAQWSIDPLNLSLGGGSAGGNLAAATALMARDQGGPPLRLALLEVPALDLTGGHLDRSLGAAFGDPDSLAGVFADYLGDPDRAKDPLASPLLAESLVGLAPFHVMTAELDPLRGDGESFLARLADAGVPASGGRRAGHLHPSASFTAVFPPAREWRAEVLAVLADAHGDSRARA